MDKHYIKPKDERLKKAMTKYSNWLTEEIEKARTKLKNSDHNSDQA